jgi:hypothetical protein
VSPRAVLDTDVRGKILCPCRESNLQLSVVQSDTIMTAAPPTVAILYKIKEWMSVLSSAVRDFMMDGLIPLPAELTKCLMD